MSAFEDVTKAVLKPRNEGEALKVKQTVLKRRDRNLKSKAEQAKKIVRERKEKKQKRMDRMMTPALLVKKQLNKQKEKNRLRRVDKKKALNPNSGNCKVLICVRNRRQVTGNKEVNEVLKGFKLKKYNNLVFLDHNLENLKKLRIAGPYVYYGFPTFKTLNDILHKKVCFKAPGSSFKVDLSSNQLVEEHLGDEGLLCIEDLVDVIHNGGEKLSKITEKLWPVELGDFTQHKADGFKVNIHEHLSGNVKEKINERLAVVL